MLKKQHKMNRIFSRRKTVIGSVCLGAFSLLIIISRQEYKHGLIGNSRSELKTHFYQNGGNLSSLQQIKQMDSGLNDILPATEKVYENYTNPGSQNAPESIIEFKKRLNEFREATRLIYNRVPKCGSTAVHVTMGNLRKVLNYNLHISSKFTEHHLVPQGEKGVIRQIMNLKEPWIFDRHVFFLNFTAYGKQMPLYINNIRDPIDRISSWYYFIRFQHNHIRPMPKETRMRTYDACVEGDYEECTSVHNYTKYGNFILVPFFCGHEDYCSEQSERALEQAKRNVLKHYVVVGLMEDLPNFFYTLEYLLPQYFKGALQDYTQNSKKLSRTFSTKKKIKPTEKTRERMKSLIPREYEFYRFVKQRFYHILEMVKTLEREEQGVEIEI